MDCACSPTHWNCGSYKFWRHLFCMTVTRCRNVTHHFEVEYRWQHPPYVGCGPDEHIPRRASTIPEPVTILQKVVLLLRRIIVALAHDAAVHKTHSKPIPLGPTKVGSKTPLLKTEPKPSSSYKATFWAATIKLLPYARTLSCYSSWLPHQDGKR